MTHVTVETRAFGASSRLRDNPELQSALVRITTCLFGALYIAVGAATDYYRVDLPYYLILFLLYLASNLGFLMSIARRPSWPARVYVGIWLDVVAISLAIFITQEAISPFYLLYILVFISAGTRFGSRHLLVASVTAVLAYNLVLIALDEWSRHTFEATFFLALLVILPWYQHLLLRKVRDAQAEAERANQAKGRFLAFMTHELRTPLTGVIGMAELLKGTRLDHEQSDMVEAIVSSAEVLGALIGDILDHSKIEAHQLELERLPFDPRAPVREVCRVLGERARAGGLELICELAPDLPRRVIGDPLRLRQILFNLVGNAVKFTERGQVRVRVTACPPGAELQRPHLLFEVIDTGIGIAASALPHLFERFRQADESTTRRFGGTGLGTTIARELALLMDGAIGVESVEGQGSRFWVRLPLEDAAPALGQGDAAPEAQESVEAAPLDAGLTPLPEAARCRVLVAEDNPIAARVITSFLDKLGCARTCVGDGEAALGEALTGDYALAIVDLRMPRLDGLGFTRAYQARMAARTDERPLPIVALTANASEEVRQSCLAAGMSGFLAKPVKPIELRRLLLSLTATDAAASAAIPPG